MMAILSLVIGNRNQFTDILYVYREQRGIHADDGQIEKQYRL